MSTNYYLKFLELDTKFGNIRKDKESFDWFLKYHQQIISDAVKYQPPKEYKYMITFTVDPKLHDQTNPEVQDEIEMYIQKLMNQSYYEKVYYVKEHADTNCHWHVVVYLNHIFKQDTVRYYRKKYGNVDISRSKDLSDEHTQKYLSKDPDCQIIQIK